MTIAPTETGGFLAVVEMVDMSTWGARGRLFAHVARRTIEDPSAGAKITSRAASEALGTDHRYVYRLLHELRRDRVLVLVQRGAGRRATRWRVNPDLRGWRHVPWRVSVELACWRVLGLAGVPEDPLVARSEPVVARSHSATQRSVVSRSHSATQRSDLSRSHSATLRNGYVAPLKRDTTGAPSLYRGSPGVAPAATPVSGEREELISVLQVVTEATGCDVWGRLEEHLGQLVATRGAQAVIDAAAGVDPIGMRAPAFVRALERVLNGEQTPDLEAGSKAAERRKLESDRAYLQLMVRQHEEHHAELEATHAPGWQDTSDLDRYRAELAACEHELSALEARGAAS